MAETDCEQTEILMKECFSVPWSVDALKEMFHTKGYCSFLAKEETEVIGYIGMKVVLDEADITNVAVLPAYRKKGIARKLLQQLKAAGLIEVSRGTGGVTITRPLDEITFLDIYKAVECAPDEQLFHFHENPNQQCPVGKNIHRVLDDRLLQVQKAMEDKLAQMTLADVKKDVTMCIEK